VSVDFDLTCAVPPWRASVAFRLSEAAPCLRSVPYIGGAFTGYPAFSGGLVGQIGLRGSIEGAFSYLGQCSAQTGVQGTAYGDIGDITGQAAGEYDPNAWRGPGIQPLCLHSELAGTDRIEGIPWESGLALRPTNRQAWQDAIGIGAGTSAPLSILERRPAFDTIVFDEARSLSSQYEGLYVHARRSHAFLDGLWAEGTRSLRQYAAPFVLAWPRKQTRELLHQLADPRITWFDLSWKAPGRWRHGAPQWWVPWGLGRRPPFIWPLPISPEPPTPPVPFTGDVDFNLWCELPDWRGCITFALDQQPCRNAVPCHLYGIIRSFIIVVNTLSLTLTNGVQIPCESIEIKSDMESWTWALRANFKGYPPEALIEAQREAIATLDSHVFHFLLESYDTSRVFGSVTGSVTGRGLAAYLADPYAEKHSRVEASTRSAAQCAEDELYGYGWTLNWDTVDWLLLPNTLSYEAETPLSAIKVIADSIGAVMQSHPEQKILSVMPRYPVDPWQIATASPQAVIPGDIINSLSARWLASPLYRGVWVSGRDQGVAVRVVRSGSDGDPYHQMIVDPLITQVDAARERGRNVICAGGKRAMITVVVPLATTPGLILPGSVVRVDQSPSWKAYAYGVTITAQHGKVWQTVELERIYETP
jgi:hypothetical protein